MEYTFKDFIREMVQGMSECIDTDEPIQLTDEEMEKAVECVANDRVWESVDAAIIETIEEIITNRKADLQERKEDEAKDERYK